jgi:hypothetical protein
MRILDAVECRRCRARCSDGDGTRSAKFNRAAALGQAEFMALEAPVAGPQVVEGEVVGRGEAA